MFTCLLQGLSVSPNLLYLSLISCLPVFCHLLVSMSARLSILSVLSLGLLYLEVGSVIVSIWVEERFPGLEWKLISWNNRNNLLHPHSCPGTRAHSHWGRLQLLPMPSELCSSHREGMTNNASSSGATSPMISVERLQLSPILYNRWTTFKEEEIHRVVTNHAPSLWPPRYTCKTLTREATPSLLGNYREQHLKKK